MLSQEWKFDGKTCTLSKIKMSTVLDCYVLQNTLPPDVELVGTTDPKNLMVMIAQTEPKLINVKGMCAQGMQLSWGQLIQCWHSIDLARNGGES